MKSTINYQPSTVNHRAFTLVELLIVMAILSSLVGLVAGGFRSSQMKARDVQRKSDLKEIANALELLISDHGKYPSDENGLIRACPFGTTEELSGSCAWGSGTLWDGRTVYLKKVPKDPSSGLSYYYRGVPNANNLKFQIFAHLENTQDPSLISGVTYQCGSKICNFAVTSSNTDYSE